jgi:hypothetical protein
MMREAPSGVAVKIPIVSPKVIPIEFFGKTTIMIGHEIRPEHAHGASRENQ